MKKKIVCLILLGILAFSGCTRGEGEKNSFNVTGNLTQGQGESRVMTLSMRVPETLNPLRNREETVDTILKLIYQPL